MDLKKGYSHKIDNQFTIHIAEDKKENLEKILELNIKVHGDSVREYINSIFIEHPRKNEVLWFYIEDNYTNKAISGISLFPLEWNIENITIPMCEMGFVGTLEDYRGKDFINELNKLYELVMTERGYIISVIRGIPYFYRKLGYEFAIPLDERILLSPAKIPTIEIKNLKFREAKANDIEIIAKMYDKYYQDFFISNNFDKNSYIFKHVNEEYNDFKTKTYIIEENGISIAFFTFGRTYDNLGYDIKTSRLNREQSIKIFQFVNEIHGLNNNDDIDLAIRKDTILWKEAVILGGVSYHDYGWQVKIPNLELYFQKTKLILENRVKNSIYKGLTQNIKISNYKETIEFRFNNGNVSAINVERGYPEVNTCDLQMPGSTLYKLILGDRTFNEINYIVKDSMIKWISKELINTLFPKESSFSDSYY